MMFWHFGQNIDIILLLSLNTGLQASICLFCSACINFCGFDEGLLVSTLHNRKATVSISSGWPQTRSEPCEIETNS
ncbi:hypothetical protein K432DRAFT_385327 [Lepidopterella palustris CBS 459.81]|uniref:Secreted protein n=1 Tax=Lepidopterella palustris CBS 459.81 TaxID=1314670 RepID=A0A8E2E3M7_9PEZI|nr:hypothetical protein K432DRAFT_385327 [Lepidopterella palustris CBS 459.81]